MPQEKNGNIALPSRNLTPRQIAELEAKWDAEASLIANANKNCKRAELAVFNINSIRQQLED